MLTLSRNVGESIIIGPNGEIVLTIGHINGNRVKLHFNASADIPIDREEIYWLKRREGQNAGILTATDATKKEEGEKGGESGELEAAEGAGSGDDAQ